MIKTLLKSLSSFGIVSIFSQLVSFFLIPLYTKKLTPVDYGVMEFTNIINTVLAVVLSVQLAQAVLRYLVDAKSDFGKKVIISTAFWSVITISGSFILLVGIIYSISGKQFFFPADYESIFYFNLVLIFFTVINGLLNAVLVWQMHAKKSAIVNITGIIVSISGSVYFILILNKGLIGSYYAGVAATGVQLLLLLYLNRKVLAPIISVKRLIKMLYFSFPLIFSSLAYSSWFFIDRFLIEENLSKDALGIFSVAAKFASPLGVLLGVLEVSLFPIVLNNYENEDTKLLLKNTFLVVMSCLFLFSGIIALFSKEIFQIMTEKSFWSGHTILFWMAISLIFSKIYFFNPGFSIEKKSSLFLRITITFSVVNFIVNYILIKKFGLYGAALATAITAVGYFCTLYYFSIKFYRVAYDYKKVIAIFVTTVILYLLSANLDLGLSLRVTAFIAFAVLLFYINRGSIGNIAKKNLIGS